MGADSVVATKRIYIGRDPDGMSTLPDGTRRLFPPEWCGFIDVLDADAARTFVQLIDARAVLDCLLDDLVMGRLNLLDPKLHVDGCKFRLAFTRDFHACDCGLVERFHEAAARVQTRIDERQKARATRTENATEGE